MIKKLTAKVSFLYLTVCLLVLGSVGAMAQTPSAYVSDFSDSIDTMKSDAVSLLPAALGIFALLAGITILVKLFRRVAK